MKKIILITAALILAFNAFCLEVDEKELKGTENTTIEFINYAGPHKVIDSAESIRGIGSILGTEIGKDATAPSAYGTSARYRVVHAVDAEEKGKLDADIIFIGSDATVDHIDNVRRIISGYLSSAYGYSEKDAASLSVFVTVYNAVYRGKLDVYQAKYKSVVLKNLTEADCGLSVNYKDWPGKSQIVIPLFDVKDGGISTVDTSVISDTKVVDSMKEDDGKNIDSRKDMVDLKERESEKASEKAKTAQKNAVEEQKKLDEQKAKTAEIKKEAEQAQKKADEKQKTAQANPNDKQAQKEAAEAKKDAEKKQEAVKQEEKKEAEQEKKTEKAKETAKTQQAVADKKQTEAQSERKEIAKDQKEVQKAEEEAEKAPSDYGLILSDEKNLLSKLVKFNRQTGAIIKNSPVSVIRNRTIYKAADGYIAIAGEEKGNGAIKLVVINADTMEIASECENKIAADSVLVQDGSDYYCVVNDDGKFYVAKFGSDLSLKLKSPVEVKSSTPITVNASELVVTGKDGKLKVISKSDLKDVASGK